MGVTDVHPGEIWLARLDPVTGHEQGGSRPVAVVSSDAFGTLPIRMAIVVPLTGRNRELVTQPRISGASTGRDRPSFARPEDIRSIAIDRLDRRLGHTTVEELAEIRKLLRYFLDM